MDPRDGLKKEIVILRSVSILLVVIFGRQPEPRTWSAGPTHAPPLALNI